MTMLSRAFAVLVVAALFAGCSSAPSEPAAATESASSSQSVLTFAPPPPTTDTLHLLDAPHMAGTLPDGLSEPLKMRVPSALEVDFADLVWRMPRPDLHSVVASVVLWVEVEGTVANPGVGCFWSMMLRVEATDGWSGTEDCVDEPQVVPTGVRLIQFDFVMDIAGLQGETLAIALATSGAQAPGSTVSVLAGTLEQDSRLTILDLQIPLETKTLL